MATRQIFEPHKLENLMFDPNAKLWKAVMWTLRISVALQCLGFAREAIRFNTSVFSFLWNSPDVGGLGWSEATAMTVQQTAGWCLVIAAVLTLVRPCWPVLLPVVLWQLALAGAKTHMGGDHFSDINLITQLTRIVTPLVLMIVDPWPRGEGPSSGRVSLGMNLLRIVVAITFAAHGYEAWQLHPKFVDLNIVAAQSLLGWSMTQGTAETLLRVIGVVDLLVAVLLIAARWPAVAFYMTFWGLVTAVSRTVAAGPTGFAGSYHQTLMRVCHAGAPLAIALYWMLLRRHVESTVDESLQPERTEKA